jgi:hypothetical protein
MGARWSETTCDRNEAISGGRTLMSAAYLAPGSMGETPSANSMTAGANSHTSTNHRVGRKRKREGLDDRLFVDKSLRTRPNRHFQGKALCPGMGRSPASDSCSIYSPTPS